MLRSQNIQYLAHIRVLIFVGHLKLGSLLISVDTSITLVFSGVNLWPYWPCSSTFFPANSWGFSSPSFFFLELSRTTLLLLAPPWRTSALDFIRARMANLLVDEFVSSVHELQKSYQRCSPSSLGHQWCFDFDPVHKRWNYPFFNHAFYSQLLLVEPQHDEFFFHIWIAKQVSKVMSLDIWALNRYLSIL